MRMKNSGILVAIFLAVSASPSFAQCSGFRALFGGCSTSAPVAAVPGSPVKSAELVPAFDSVNSVTPLPGRNVIQPMNDTYFADESTAQALAKRFGADRVELRPTGATVGGWAVYADGSKAGQRAESRVLVFTIGALLKDSHGDAIGRVATQFEINAGVLADYFRRMPEKQFPAYSYVYGFPPVTTYMLSLPEQYVWRLLYSLVKDAEANPPVPAPTPAAESHSL